LSLVAALVSASSSVCNSGAGLASPPGISHHGLYGSTSCCISQWPSQWGWANFDPPQLRNHLIDFDEIRILELPSEDHPPSKISFRSDDLGGLGEYPVCHATVGFLSLPFFLFFGLFVTCTGRTSGPILTIYTSYDVFLPKDVPFGGFVDMPARLGGKIPQKPQFWGRE